MNDYNTSASEVGEVIGISSRNVRLLAEAGIFKRVSRGEYDLRQCVQAYIQYKLDKALEGMGSIKDERTRLLKAQADLKELTLQKQRGEVLNTEIAMRLWGAVCQRIRQKLLNIPVKLPPLVAGLTVPQIKVRTQDFIYEVLTELSEIDLKDFRNGKRPRNKK